MDTIDAKTADFILKNIDKSKKRLEDVEELIEEYKFQIENIGMTSDLGQEFVRNLNSLKEEKSRISQQLEKLEQYTNFNTDNLNQQEEQNIAFYNNYQNENDSIEQKKQSSEPRCDYYKISSVAAFKNGHILDAIIINDEHELSSKVSQLFYEYGNDISVKLNRDAYLNGTVQPISENIGWIDLDDYYKSETKPSNTMKQKSETIEDDYQEEYKFDEIADSYENGSIYNFKVVYKHGKYRIDFDIVEDDDIVHQTYENKISVDGLYSEYHKRNLAKKCNINRRTKFYKNMDVNLLLALKEIDDEYGTDYIEDYKNGKLKVKYDLRDIFSNKYLKLKERLTQRKVALKQTKITNAIVEGAYYPEILVGAISGLILMSTLGISSILPSFGKKHSNKQSTNNATQVVKEMPTTTQAVTIEEIVNKTVNDDKNTKVENNTTTEDKSKTEDRGLALNDSLVLVNKDNNNNIKYTYKLSENIDNEGNKLLASDYSDCDKFKISSIAVCKNGQKLEEVTTLNNKDNIQTGDLYAKYGKDADILLNFDAYKAGETTPTYKNIGWLNLNDFKSKDSNSYVSNISKEKAKIEKENKANSIVESLTKETVDENKQESNYCDFGLDGKITLFYKDANGNLSFSQDLTGDAWGNGDIIDAGKIGCDYFKISYIAVYDGNTVLDVKEIKDEENVDEITTNMYQEYGKDVSVSYNFNGYMNDNNEPLYKNVGWININKIVNVTEKLQKANITNTSNSSKIYVKK